MKPSSQVTREAEQEDGGAASPEPLGKLPPKPPPFQLQEALYLCLKVFGMVCQSLEGGNILTPSRYHESQNKKMFLKFLRES